MAIWITRSGWGARNPTCRTQFPGPLLGLAVHYSASAADEQDQHSNCAGRVRGIQNYHMGRDPGDPSKPWCDIAYSFLVCRHGFIFVGRGFDVRPASQGLGKPGGNEHYYSVCFLGNDRVGRQDVTIPAYEAILAVRNSVAGKGGHEVHPHSFWYATACPGNELRSWIADGAKDPRPPPPEEFHCRWRGEDGVLSEPKHRSDIHAWINNHAQGDADWSGTVRYYKDAQT